ncbi:hypothetical protein JQC92_02270 [Shewanella sp. 202IG2-18]|uniref:hypothetical protein n=1 Tax=Parashewanella hymeniacidonis TaxID=2807618 RepID=UPI001960E932|nr:hypothetical protein [Parashewanella hymeniacidonis]MBM7070866.1 hypothetical protein [Parashewanella hymeniacidonis]
MAGGLLRGLERGYNLVERHKESEFRRQRLSDIDARNEQRYADSQKRLADIDSRNEQRYQDSQKRYSLMDKRNEDRYQDTLDYREQQQAAAKENRDWQKSRTERNDQWKQDQQMMGAGWDYFMQNGDISPEHKEMFERNAGYSPMTFMKPEYREKVKFLDKRVNEIVKSGKLSEANSPDVINAFNEIYSDRIKRSVGEFDSVRGTNIKDVNFHGFIPVGEKGDVTFALKVDYENGDSSVQAMSKGRSADPKDPPEVMSPQELIQTMKAKTVMADMMERPDYWSGIGRKMGAGSRGGSSSDKTEAAYRKELSAIERDLANQKAKIMSSDDHMDDESRSAAVERVEQVFSQRRKAIDESYGIKPKEKKQTGAAEQSPDTSKLKSKLDGYSPDNVIQKIMESNKGMTKDQAIKAAVSQGYLSNVE